MIDGIEAIIDLALWEDIGHQDVTTKSLIDEKDIGSARIIAKEDFLLAGIENIKIDKQNFKLSATIIGDKASNYKFSNHVKAITYNEMFVKKQKNKWIVQVVIDV